MNDVVEHVGVFICNIFLPLEVGGSDIVEHVGVFICNIFLPLEVGGSDIVEHVGVFHMMSYELRRSRCVFFRVECVFACDHEGVSYGFRHLTEQTKPLMQYGLDKLGLGPRCVKS